MAVPPFRCELEARWQATAGQDLMVGTSGCRSGASLRSSAERMDVVHSSEDKAYDQSCHTLALQSSADRDW